MFPNHEGDFLIWLQRSGKKHLMSLSKSLVRKNYAICHRHFDASCESLGTNRLKFRSLSTLHLPSKYYIFI